MKPCDWPINYGDPNDPDECLGEFPESVSAATRAAIEDLAVEMLWAWTGRRLGVCPATVRPCRAECPEGVSTFWGGSAAMRPGLGWVPVLIGGQWFNIGCGSCGSEVCSCAPDASRALRLPGPVASITSIWIDGAELPTSAYMLRDDTLIRTDGEIWPACNDDLADAHAPDSTAWEVKYERGIEVPPAGQLAAALLSLELAKAVCRDKSCQLPQRVQSITRQGVSMAVLDSFEDLKEGRTGIWIIDSWVASQNAPRISPPQVYSPDIAPGRGRGTWAGIGRGRTR